LLFLFHSLHFVILAMNLFSHKLEGPSLTVQWLPDVQEGSDHTTHQIIYGTHTSNDQNRLVIAKLKHEGWINRARYM
jgi:hypothetical protein